MKHFLLYLMGLLSFITGCSRPTLVEGGLYCTPADKGRYSVLKILKLDERGVHVRVFSNPFSEPPKAIDEKNLYMAGMDRKPNESLGMGHLPLSRKSFQTWNAKFIQQSTVKEEELEGYKTWLDAKGGYF